MVLAPNSLVEDGDGVLLRLNLVFWGGGTAGEGKCRLGVGSIGEGKRWSVPVATRILQREKLPRLSRGVELEDKRCGDVKRSH